MRILIITGGRIDEDFALSLLEKEKFEHMIVVYMVTFFTLMLGLLACELDPITAFSALASCMNNLGPALGDATAHYGNLPDAAQLILSLAMILGRLEVFSLLVLLSPAFWRY